MSSTLDRQAIITTESLISAIKSFDVEEVEKLLKGDLEIMYRNSDHHSVLHTAVALIDTGTMRIARSKEEANKHLNSLFSPKALRRIVELLLESGRFNVDALADSSETALHLAVEGCRCRIYFCEDYKDMVNAIIKLLLKYNANINAKNIDGQTPLMRASFHGCSHIVQLLLDWRDKNGAGVDLNARNIYGETALIKAATGGEAGVVELLLQHGCLDKFQDHRGFYALHAVIYGSDLISNASSDFLALIGVLTSEEAPLVLDRYAAHSSIGNMLCIQWTGNDWRGNDSMQKTVSLLVMRGCSDINSSDFRGNTVLDAALKSKLRISQKTVEKLKEYGATSKHPEYQKNILQYTDKLGKTPLHRLSTVLTELTLGKKVEIFMNHLNSSPHKEAFEEMTVAKDHRGRTALHYAVMPTGIDVALKSEDIVLLINVLKLECLINVRDNYGRTPLHYCQDEDVYESLVMQRADEQIRDIDGKTPQDLTNLRKEGHNRHNLPNKLEDQVDQEKIDAWIIWEDFEYAYRDEFSKKIRNKVRQFMNRLSDEIGKKDRRFECRPVLIGSAAEGTKTGLPDEFDFNFILTKLSDLCEVVPSPEVPNGYVHLKRRYNNAEYWQASQDFEGQEDFGGLFNNGDFLLTTEIACRFTILYLQVMSEPEFWEGEDFFEWNPHNEVGLIYDKQERQYEVPEVSDDFMPLYHPCSTVQLKLNRPIEGRYTFTLISLDIVPCIKLNGWWPEEALSSLNDTIKLEGCHLMFYQPQKMCPWVPFSDPFAKISFAPADGRIIKECSAVARAAYMVGKQLLYYHGKPKLTYVLKTCLLYCIEALKDCTSNSLCYENINPRELRFFVEKLMLCFNEFYRQDFLPCYMMPSFHLSIEDYLKSNHDKLLNDSNFQYPSLAHELYCKVCRKKSPGDFCPPTPEPLSEKFNREQLMRKLSMKKSSIEKKQVVYRRVQSESLVTGQMVQPNSQSGSQVRLSANRKRRLQMKANKSKVKKRDFTETK